MVFRCVCMVYYWLKMANQGLGTYSNVFWTLKLWKCSPNLGPWTHYLLPDYIKKYKSNAPENGNTIVHISTFHKSKNANFGKSRGTQTDTYCFGGSKTIFNLDNGPLWTIIAKTGRPLGLYIYSYWELTSQLNLPLSENRQVFIFIISKVCDMLSPYSFF